MAIVTGQVILAADVLAIGATREKFFPVAEVGSSRGDFPVVAMAVDNGVARISGHIPHDFITITEFVAIIVAGATDAAEDIDIDSDYGTSGEAYNANSESNTAATYNLTSDQLFEINLSGIFSAVAADDYFGVKITNKSTDHIEYAVGVRLKYS